LALKQWGKFDKPLSGSDGINKRALMGARCTIHGEALATRGNGKTEVAGVF